MSFSVFVIRAVSPQLLKPPARLLWLHELLIIPFGNETGTNLISLEAEAEADETLLNLEEQQAVSHSLNPTKDAAVSSAASKHPSVSHCACVETSDLTPQGRSHPVSLPSNFWCSRAR